MKNAYVILVSLIFLLVCGCSQTVPGSDIEGAVSACKEHGGVKQLEPLPAHNSLTTCRDGEQFYIARPAN